MGRDSVRSVEQRSARSNRGAKLARIGVAAVVFGTVGVWIGGWASDKPGSPRANEKRTQADENRSWRVTSSEAAAVDDQPTIAIERPTPIPAHLIAEWEKLTKTARSVRPDKYIPARAFAWDLTAFLYDHPESLPHAILLLRALDAEGLSMAVEATATAICRFGSDEAKIALIHLAPGLTARQGQLGAVQALGQARSRTRAPQPPGWNASGVFGIISFPLESERVMDALVTETRAQVLAQDGTPNLAIIGFFSVLSRNPNSTSATDFLNAIALAPDLAGTGIQREAIMNALQPFNTAALPVARKLIIESDEPDTVRAAAGLIWSKGSADETHSLVERLRQPNLDPEIAAALLNGGMLAASPRPDRAATGTQIALREVATDLMSRSKHVRVRASAMQVLKSQLFGLSTAEKQPYVARITTIVDDTNESGDIRAAALDAETDLLRRSAPEATKQRLRQIVRTREQPLRLRVMAFRQFVAQYRVADTDAVRTLTDELKKAPDWSAFRRAAERYGFK